MSVWVSESTGVCTPFHGFNKTKETQKYGWCCSVRSCFNGGCLLSIKFTVINFSLSIFDQSVLSGVTKIKYKILYMKHHRSSLAQFKVYWLYFFLLRFHFSVFAPPAEQQNLVFRWLRHVVTTAVNGFNKSRCNQMYSIIIWIYGYWTYICIQYNYKFQFRRSTVHRI